MSWTENNFTLGLYDSVPSYIIDWCQSRYDNLPVPDECMCVFYNDQICRILIHNREKQTMGDRIYVHHFGDMSPFENETPEDKQSAFHHMINLGLWGWFEGMNKSDLSGYVPKSNLQAMRSTEYIFNRPLINVDEQLAIMIMTYDDWDKLVSDGFYTRDLTINIATDSNWS